MSQFNTLISMLEFSTASELQPLKVDIERSKLTAKKAIADFETAKLTNLLNKQDLEDARKAVELYGKSDDEDEKAIAKAASQFIEDYFRNKFVKKGDN